MLVFSSVAHVITFIEMPSRPPERAPLKPLEVEMKFIEPPKPVEPEPVKPEPVKPPPKVQQVKVDLPKPVPVDAPPPPNDPAPPDAKPAPVVIGISLDNTSESGSFAVQTGNSTMGKADTKAVDPNSVKKYNAPRYVPAGGADTDPEVINDLKIAYPAEAKKAEVEGPVRLKITVDFEGNVSTASVISGPGYGLDEAALAALKKFRFKPAMKNGEAVSTTFVYTYMFLLD